MPASRKEWADAYAQQAASDFQVYEFLLNKSEISLCHKLHYLQMACEKIAKAYHFRDMQTSEAKLTTSHVIFSKFITIFLTSSPLVKAEYKGRDAQLAGFKQRVRNLAREIEKLAPAVDQEQSPSNAEYPWESGEEVTVPCRYSYPNLSSLNEPVGHNFLRLIKESIVSFDKTIIK